MKTFVGKIISKGVVLLIGILVAVLLFLSGFSLTNSVLEKHSKENSIKEVSFVQRYIFNS